MSYELRKPVSENEQMNFKAQYIYKQGLRFEDTEYFLFALEPNEIMGEKEIEIDVPDFETVTEEYEEQVYDQDGNPVYDEDGNPVTETKTREVTRPVMIEIEVEIPDYDEEGNIIGYHTEIQKVQSTHKETIIVPYPVIDPNYEEKQATKRREEFHKQFFNTSLGWIRRSVTMQDGSKKDFLSDLLLPIKAGLELGQTVEIITYTEPDFTEDVTDWTEYQIVKNATPQFIAECLNQIVNDFKPQNESGEENSEDNDA